MSTAVMEAVAMLFQFDMYDAVAITVATVMAIVWSLQARSQSVEQPELLKQKPQAPATQVYRVTCNISRELEERNSDLLSWEQSEEEVAGQNTRMSSQIDMRQVMGHPRNSQGSVRFSKRSIAEITAPRRSGRVSFTSEQMRGSRSNMAPVHKTARAESIPRSSRPSHRISIQSLLDCGTSEVAFPAPLTNPRSKTNAHSAHPRLSGAIAPPAPRDSAQTIAYLELKQQFMQQSGTVA